MDYSKLNDEVLKLNPKIRYSGVYSKRDGKIYEKTAKGVVRKLNQQQSNKSVIQAYMRWKNRAHFQDLIGECIYAMAKYQKVNRMTLGCGKDALLMISTEVDLEPHEIIGDIRKIIQKILGDPNATPNVPTLSF